MPAGIQLSTSVETKITISTDLSFEVGVTNSGENQEVGVKVRLTIPAQPSPIVKNATLDVIDPGETKAVTFSDFPDFPFGEGHHRAGPGPSRAGGDEHRQQLGRVPGRVLARSLVSRSPAARSRGGSHVSPTCPLLLISCEGTSRFPHAPSTLTSRQVAS